MLTGLQCVCSETAKIVDNSTVLSTDKERSSSVSFVGGHCRCLRQASSTVPGRLHADQITGGQSTISYASCFHESSLLWLINYQVKLNINLLWEEIMLFSEMKAWYLQRCTRHHQLTAAEIIVLCVKPLWIVKI